MKCLENKLLLASAWFTYCSRQQFIHETSLITHDKKLDPSLLDNYTTLHVERLMDFIQTLDIYFKIGPGLVTFFLPTTKCIFLKEHFACTVLFYVHCCLQPQLSQVQFLQDLFSYKTILNHFTKMTRQVICP